MLEPKRVTSNITPAISENLVHGNWYYTYDIKTE